MGGNKRFPPFSRKVFSIIAFDTMTLAGPGIDILSEQRRMINRCVWYLNRAK